MGADAEREDAMTIQNETFTAKELAAACETDAKTFRRFVRMQAAAGDRAIIGACGQGNRYAVKPDEARMLIGAFAAWRAGRKTNAEQRTGADVLAALAITHDETDAEGNVPQD
jgi:hypothetical protein